MPSNTSSNKAVVPEAKGALDRFKYEVANELGVPLTDGYNGNLTSKQNGSVGGYMVKKKYSEQLCLPRSIIDFFFTSPVFKKNRISHSCGRFGFTIILSKNSPRTALVISSGPIPCKSFNILPISFNFKWESLLASSFDSSSESLLLMSWISFLNFSFFSRYSEFVMIPSRLRSRSLSFFFSS